MVARVDHLLRSRIMNESPIESQARSAPQEHEAPPRSGGKRSLLVFVSVLAALAMLIGLNMN
jgi:hypothetical protein